MKKKILSAFAPEPIGPYSQAVVKDNVLYASGQIAIDPKTNNLCVSDLKEETILVFNNISEVLKEAGFELDHVVKVSIFLKRMSDFSSINKWYADFFKGVEVFPARETVEVSCLPKNVNIEISFIAVR